MDYQSKGHAVSEDELNLYDLWKVVVKRKKFIIGLFLISVVVAAIISLLMPKIYGGEATFKITAKEIITAKEMVSIIGNLGKRNLDKEKIKQVLPKTFNSIDSIKLRALRDSADKFQVIIEAKRVDDIPMVISEFMEYTENNPLIRRSVAEDKERLLKQIEELSEVIESSKELVKAYDNLIKTGRLIPVGFNPVDLNKRISDIKLEKLFMEQALKRLKGIEMIAPPYISSKPVKPKVKLNIAIAGVGSLFVGIFLAFFFEFLERNKTSLETPV